jgi:hypothetical protein
MRSDAASDHREGRLQDAEIVEDELVLGLVEARRRQRAGEAVVVARPREGVVHRDVVFAAEERPAHAPEPEQERERVPLARPLQRRVLAQDQRAHPFDHARLDRERGHADGHVLGAEQDGLAQRTRAHRRVAEDAVRRHAHLQAEVDADRRVAGELDGALVDVEGDVQRERALGVDEVGPGEAEGREQFGLLDAPARHDLDHGNRVRRGNRV